MALLGLLIGLVPAGVTAQDDTPSTDDPRYTLQAGYDAETASLGFEHLAWIDREDTALTRTNSDLSFTRGHAIQGNFSGFHIIDIRDPASPRIRTTVICPGGQGDTTVHGNLLFHSVEEPASRVDCQSGGVTSENRFQGVRIWDIADLDNPVQVAAIQTCRGSHTHRLVEDLDDPDHVYVYVNGTQRARPDLEFVHRPEGLVQGFCLDRYFFARSDASQWMIEVIKVPVANPAAAAVVNEARLFQVGDAVDGLQNGPTRSGHPCSDSNACAPAGNDYSPTPRTNACHDITAYPEIGLAAGACEGNGLLIDISDPANPVRIDAVADPNFSYWHSANFNNDGTTVMFTDEWGGGPGARCVPQHRMSWGANALYTIDRSGPTPTLEFASYYKLPAAQPSNENCVAHQANLLPVPGRDIMVQAWYQGGISLFDMTDPAHPFEIGYFDRGAVSSTGGFAGYWSAYWHNGAVYGSETRRGFDSFRLTPTAWLSQNEIRAAEQVVLEEHNAMAMRQYTWEPSFAVAGSFVDQAERAGTLAPDVLTQVRQHLSQAEKLDGGNANKRAVIAQLDNAIRKAGSADPAVTEALQDLRATY